MAYVDGFVVPVPKKQLQAYRRLARMAGKIWREHGALEFRECLADDVKVGKWTSFPRSVKLKANDRATGRCGTPRRESVRRRQVARHREMQCPGPAPNIQ